MSVLEQSENNGYNLFKSMAITAEFHDRDIVEHIDRVSTYAQAIARGIGLEEETQRRIRIASVLHDVGKSSIPREVLLKPGLLNEAERLFIEHHTREGFQIIRTIEDLLQDQTMLQLYYIDEITFTMAKDIALSHHECWDGTGYPEMRRGQETPMHARIVHLADVLDALLTKRVYKQAWTLSEVMQEITQRKGTWFDPDLTGWVERHSEELIKGS